MTVQYQLLLYVQTLSVPDYQGVCSVFRPTGSPFSSQDAHALLLDMMGFCEISRALAGSVIALDGSGFSYWEHDLVSGFPGKEVCS